MPQPILNAPRAGGKYKNQAKNQNQSWKPPETQRGSGHNANLWSEFNYVLIETQLLPNVAGVGNCRPLWASEGTKDGRPFTHPASS